MPILLNGSQVKAWTDDLDENTLKQAQRTADMPFVRGHVALMPDAHFGYGATVGSVIPTEGAIVPAAVGVDIGCGMIAARLELDASDLPDNLDGLHSAIAAAVPAGVGKGHDTATAALLDLHEDRRKPPMTLAQMDTAAKQMGSLGSGNHFIEVCLDEADQVWLVLHSGSRGIGNQLATQYCGRAKSLMQKYFITLDDPDLAYLVEGTDDFDEYIAAMLWAQDYAMVNRQTMYEAVLACTRTFLGRWVEPLDVINCHHNFTAREHHHGRNLWITRKGAIRARTGDRGVIPGSMGAASYIVSGLEHPASYHSCSHGAGRRLSRTAARRTLDEAGLEAAMAGKAWNRDAHGLLDEDPRAYKDIDVVMENQRDLVKIEHTLHQVLNYKGL